MNPRTVIVSTDEPLLETGVRTILTTHPEFKLLQVVGNHAETLEAIRVHHPDIIVYGLAAGTDMQAAREVQSTAPRSTIVLLGRELSTEVAHHAVQLGILGFLSTRSTLDQFIECLQACSRGELWMEPSLTMKLLNNPPIKLSKRQSELIALLVHGLKNKEIATTLGISEGTVKAYLTTLYEKVGARDRFELALFGLKNLGNRRPPGSATKIEPLRTLVTRREVRRAGA